MLRPRPVGQADRVQRGVEHLARPIAGEHPAGAVGPMGCRRQADDRQRGVRRPEAGHRPAPVLLIAERRALLHGNGFAPGDQPRAGPAADDLLVQGGQIFGLDHGMAA
jgi:hypothetical protein